MKTSKPAILLLLATVAIFAGSLVYAAGQLPGRVASHFGFGGEANGWMSKEADLIFMVIVGLGLPLFIMALCHGTRYLPSWMVNLPHREYWLAPERRGATADYMFGHSIWFGSLIIAFMTWVHLLVVFANQHPAPQLSTPLLLPGLICFFVATGVWVWRLLRHFRVPQ